MRSIKRIGISRIAICAIAAVIASAGAAFAAGGGNSDNGGDNGQDRGSHGGQGRGPGGPGGPGGNAINPRYATYAEFHSYRHGKETVTRMDTGKVKAISESEITVTERDGNEVTIPLDEDTEVFAPDVDEPGIDDVKTGQTVTVGRTLGEPADHIGIRPLKKPKQFR